MSEQGNSPTIPWFAWLLLGATIAAVIAGFVLIAIGCRELMVGTPSQRLTPVAQAISSMFFAIIGILILKRHPSHSVGWICLLIATTAAIQWNYSAVHGACTALQGAGASTAYWINYVLGFINTYLTFVLLPMLFPNGGFLTHRWRRIATVGAIWIGCLALPIVLLPGPMQWPTGEEGAPANPFSVDWLPEALGPVLGTLLIISMLLLAITAIGSAVLRYRRARGDLRQQMKWFIYYLVALIIPWAILFEVIGGLLFPAIFETVIYAAVTFFVSLGYPIVIGIAVLRYRLYDIDIIIRRTLVYALVTAALVLIYFGSIIFLQRIFVTITGQESTVAIVVSTLLIAALFHPLRQRVQRLIDRRFYRGRYDVEQTLARFALVARDEVKLETLTHELHNAVEDALQPERLSVWLDVRRSGRQE